jgi:hypothetical protein
MKTKQSFILIFLAGFSLSAFAQVTSNNFVTRSTNTQTISVLQRNPTIMTDIKEKLNSIWKADYFMNGHKYFWLYNFNFFRFVEKDEFEEFNKEVVHRGKRIFAVADGGNSDNEPQAYLYFDTATRSKVFIQSAYDWIEPKELRKIADDLNQLFGEEDYSKIFIAKKDSAFWAWNESCFNSYSIEKVVPKGVLPNVDLRIFFKEHVNGTFLSDHKEIPIKEFYKYFETYGCASLDTEELFSFKPTAEDLDKFVGKLNAQLGKKVFYVVSFNPSDFWGIGNFEQLTPKQAEQLHNYGLIN